VEKHIFVADGEDPKARSSTRQRDPRLDVILLLSPTDRILSWKGPYTVVLHIFEGTQWRGELDSVEVAAAFLEVRYRDGLDRKLVLSDWRRVADAAAPGIYYVGRLPQKTLDVDHERVQEIKLYLEVTAVLKDGTRHKHVTERRYKPVVLQDWESLAPSV
jgi:hypothetical protein